MVSLFQELPLSSNFQAKLGILKIILITIADDEGA
jgi:hypothetical protein